VSLKDKMLTVPFVVCAVIVLAAVGGSLLVQPSALNLVIGAAATALLVVCVGLIPADDLAGFYRFTAWVFVFGALLNVAYELWHSVYYTHFSLPGMAYPAQVRMLLTASVSDGFLAVVSLFAVTAVRRGRWRWDATRRWSDVIFVAMVALAIQVGVELEALSTGRWGYTDLMPLIPLLRVGLTPAIQMPLLMLPILSLAQRVSGCPATPSAQGWAAGSAGS